jgi:2-hydroxyglutarate dehydrogenase
LVRTPWERKLCARRGSSIAESVVQLIGEDVLVWQSCFPSGGGDDSPADPFSWERLSVVPPDTAEVVVVGAGILGLATARELAAREPDRRVVVLEREDGIAAHQTSHNSGVIHAGIYYPPGSLKARLCIEGARLLYEYCDRNDIPYRRTGKLIVAASEAELGRLDDLEARGRANEVPGLRRVDRREMAEIEPQIAGVAGLHSPATGVVDYAQVAEALAQDVEAAGGVVATGCAVASLTRTGGRTRVVHQRGVTDAAAVVTCAGAWSDELARRAGAPDDPRIVPFRGSYHALAPPASERVRGLVYPVPDPRLPFLGVHLTRHIDGTVTVGPTALLVGARRAYRLRDLSPTELVEALRWPGTARMLRRHWRSGLLELQMAASRRSLARAAARYLPGLRAADLSFGFAGIRAQALARDGTLVDDFVFSETPGALHVRNAPSPAATASLAIAMHVADRAESALG